jgi:hypothetical protein
MRSALPFVVILAALGTSCSESGHRERDSSTPGVTAAVNASIRVGAPITQGNLAVYPLYSSTSVADSEVLTLEEGLKAGVLKIEEISDPNGNDHSDVNRLRIHNSSGKTVFLMSGEIVQGGKQDRVIAQDLTLAPGTTTVDLPVFCVEPGRWSLARHDDFNSPQFAAPPAVKNAAQNDGNQQLVWNQVANTNNVAIVTGFGGLGSARGLILASESSPSRPHGASSRPDSVASSAPAQADYALLEVNSDSTLMNAFADDAMRTKVEPCVAAILKKLAADTDATGIAVFDGEKLVAVDLFHCRKVFVGLQPKLLRSYALQVAGSAESRPAAHEAPTRDRVVDLVTRALEAPTANEIHVGASRNGRFDLREFCGVRSYANDGVLVHLNVLRRD